MDFTINIQELKKCNYMIYELSDEDFKPYNPRVWDIETSKKKL